jgi:hypothetical protein
VPGAAFFPGAAALAILNAADAVLALDWVDPTGTLDRARRQIDRLSRPRSTPSYTMAGASTARPASTQMCGCRRPRTGRLSSYCRCWKGWRRGLLGACLMKPPP